MRGLVWIVAVAALVVWSLLAWGVGSVVDTASDWAAANADLVSSSPGIIETLSWALGGLGSAGEVIVAVVWLIGVIVIVLIALAARYLARGGKLPGILRRG
ncbi:MAG: hypothetical protein FJX20_18765 [Alphaproteobacteria bacterium]|nr:hypothetical protein [Alphaproteobacteria bacterium]